MMAIEYNGFDEYIQKCVKKYGQGLDQEECYSEGWRTFLEAREAYPAVAGCCDFDTYAEFCLKNCMEQMRQKRSHRIRLFSPFSLDTPCYEGEESFLARLPAGMNNFTHAVELWDYLDRMGTEKRGIAQMMIDRAPDREIMEERRIHPERYYTLLEELREDMRGWLAI